MGGHKRPALPPSRANSDGRPNRRSDISPRPNPNELPPRAATALGRSPGIARCDRFAEGSVPEPSQDPRYHLPHQQNLDPFPVFPQFSRPSSTRASDKDHDLDILKNHRTEALAQNVYSLIQHGLKPLFNHHADFLLGFEDSKEHQSATPNHSTILQSTTEAFEMIDNLMRWFQKSDFCFIQEHWQASIDCAKAHMLSVIPSLNSLVRDAQESDPANNNESDPQPSATSALQQNQPFQNNSPTTFEPNPPPEASPAQEHQSEVRSASDADRSGNSSSGGSSDEMFLTPQEIKFIQASIALIKLVRIFFDKLLITPTTKPPFTFHTRVTSTEINTMGNAIDSLPCDMQSLIITLDGYWFNDGRPRCYQAKRESISVLFRFDSIIEMLRLHLVPLHPQLDLPASEPESENTFFDSCFSLLVDHFHLAVKLFGIAFDELESSRQD